MSARRASPILFRRVFLFRKSFAFETRLKYPKLSQTWKFWPCMTSIEFISNRQNALPFATNGCVLTLAKDSLAELAYTLAASLKA